MATPIDGFETIAIREQVPTTAEREHSVPLFLTSSFVFDNAAQAATLWIDGVEAAEIVNGEGGWPVQPATPAMFVGSMGLQGGQTGVWIDDVAAGPVRIGCD